METNNEKDYVIALNHEDFWQYLKQLHSSIYFLEDLLDQLPDMLYTDDEESEFNILIPELIYPEVINALESIHYEEDLDAVLDYFEDVLDGLIQEFVEVSPQVLVESSSE